MTCSHRPHRIGLRRALDRPAVRGLAVTGAALATYALVARPWYRRWGATGDDARRPLPGDDLAGGSSVGSTRAVTIEAAPEDVWPWLVQIGYERGGFYSYDWLENLFVALFGGTRGYHSANTILPEHQQLAIGDYVPAAPADLMDGRVVDVTRWKVLALEPNRLLVLEGWGAFVLERLGDCATRLIVRSRGPGAWGRLSHYLFWEPAHFVMERRMLLGIKARAERLARERRSRLPSS
jgi:hypothetical protein